MQAIVHAVDIQDRDGGVLLMGALFGLYPSLLKLYADSGYRGTKFAASLASACEQVNVEIVKRPDVGKFVVLPKRWIVERAIAWLNRDLPPAGPTFIMRAQGFGSSCPSPAVAAGRRSRSRCAAVRPRGSAAPFQG